MGALATHRLLVGTTLAIVGATSCGSASVAVPEYTGLDSARDAGGPADAGVSDGWVVEDGQPELCAVPQSLPAVVPVSTACSPRPGTHCIPDAWFCLSKWSPFFYDGIEMSVLKTNGKREPRQIVWTPRFMLDRYAVTNAEYATYIASTGASPPPDRLQYTFAPDPSPGQGLVPRPTGWKQGQPEPWRLDHPVVGVARAEAQAYCAAKGGRLPSVAEMMRAGQKPAPQTQRYPWGGVFPYPAGGFEPARVGVPPFTSPVDTIWGDLGPYGTHGLVSNVGEWLATCEEEARTTFASDAPLVLGSTVVAPRCTDAVLTTNVPDTSSRILIGQVVRSIHVEGRTAVIRYLRERIGRGSSAFDTWRVIPQDPADSTVQDAAGNDYRDFAIGFRCAYEAP